MLVGEALSRMLEAASNAYPIRGFKPAANSPLASHIQFSDDAMILCDANSDQILNAKAILHCFEVVSGLKVSFFTSELIGVTTDSSSLPGFANFLGCKVGSLLASYLGLPHVLVMWQNLFGILSLREWRSTWLYGGKIIYH